MNGLCKWLTHSCRSLIVMQGLPCRLNKKCYFIHMPPGSNEIPDLCSECRALIVFNLSLILLPILWLVSVWGLVVKTKWHTWLSLEKAREHLGNACFQSFNVRTLLYRYLNSVSPCLMRLHFWLYNWLRKPELND